MIKTRQTGFTLIEIAMVLFIVALVLGGIMTPLSIRLEQANRKQTEEILGQIKDSLIGFALVNGHLPCPDCPGGAASANCTGAAISNDGIEDGMNTGVPESNPRVNFDACAVATGNVPWVTLGVPEYDSWRQRFIYSVDQAFADDIPGTSTAGCTVTPSVSFQLCSPGDMNINDTGGNAVAQNIPALVYSLGANGNAFGGTAPTSAPELDNWWTSVSTRTFVADDYQQTAGTEFDDVVIWISPSALIYRMVTAEMLP